MSILLYNTLTRQKEEFHPLHEKEVGFYSCGPTVYDYVHIGNHRSNIMVDTVKRVLKYNGYTVTHVVNITDVGHLTDDGDLGEDKMEKGSRREGKSAWDIAKFYTHAFLNDLKDLNIQEPSVLCKATDHIQEQIEQVQQLIEKGFTYETSDGIYMDTTKVPDYGKLAQLEKQELKAGARVDMGEKKHPHDFALWKFSQHGEQRQMEWEAFGRKGFPGWHIECSAMAMKYLGNQFDLHAGGIDLSRVHHVNEIAQAESITEKKPWVKYWIHGEFLLVQNEKMSKSLGNLLTLQTIKDQGIDPLAYRYFVLQAHYRKQLNFTWEALQAAQNGLNKLRELVAHIPAHAARDPKVRADFAKAINDDLNTPEALAILWTAIKEHRIDLDMIIEFDKVLGLKLHEPEVRLFEIPPAVQKLLDDRAQARAEKNWNLSDEIRDEIKNMGFVVEDTSEGQKVKKV